MLRGICHGVLVLYLIHLLKRKWRASDEYISHYGAFETLEIDFFHEKIRILHVYKRFCDGASFLGAHQENIPLTQIRSFRTIEWMYIKL